MQILRPATWILSAGLHIGLLVAFMGISNRSALDEGTGSDTFAVEKGIAVEGLTKLGEAEQMIQTVDIPPAKAAEAPHPIEEPKLTDVVTSKEASTEEQVVSQEFKPVEQPRPIAAPAREQAPQVATHVEQSSGPEHRGGETTLRTAYLGEVRKTLEKSKITPRAHLSGTVLIGFTIGPSGQVLTREVKISSGSKVLDDAAMASLDHAAPFPPMPHDLAHGSLELQVPFKFVTP
jgi:periplasmic protein TonB